MRHRGQITALVKFVYLHARYEVRVKLIGDFRNEVTTGDNKFHAVAVSVCGLVDGRSLGQSMQRFQES